VNVSQYMEHLPWCNASYDGDCNCGGSTARLRREGLLREAKDQSNAEDLMEALLSGSEKVFTALLLAVLLVGCAHRQPAATRTEWPAVEIDNRIQGHRFVLSTNECAFGHWVHDKECCR
jgi:hypothetical protein